MSRLRQIPISRGWAFAAVMLALLLLTPVYSSGQINKEIFISLFAAVAATAPVALALGLGIVIAEFDLSVLATYGLGGTLGIKIGWGPAESAIFAAALGAVIGAIEGFIVERFRISAVPVTLGGFLILGGLVEAISHGQSVNYTHLDVTLWLTEPVVWAIAPGPMIIGGLFLLIGLILRFTRFGREMRAVGGDKSAARISGVRTGLVVTATLALGGAVAGFGGAINAFSASAANSTVTFGPVITAITAIVVGGMSLNGGYGKAGQILLGVFAMEMLTEALLVANADPNLIGLVTGGFLIIVSVATPEMRNWMLTHRPRRMSRAPSEPADSRAPV
jgi:ribose transport system permease protein